MIVVMKPNANPQEIAKLKGRLENKGFGIQRSKTY